MLRTKRTASSRPQPAKKSAAAKRAKPAAKAAKPAVKAAKRPKPAAKAAKRPKPAAKAAKRPKPAAKAAKAAKPAKPIAAKKVARRVGFNPYPIATALLKAAKKSGAVRLVRTSARGGKFAELTLEPWGAALREGALGAKGRVVKKVRFAANVAEHWLVKQAKTRLVNGFQAEGFTLPAKEMTAWLAEVARIGTKVSSWETVSEEIFER